MTSNALHIQEAWRGRLTIPNYGLGEAARYARVSPQTVASWHRRPGLEAKALPAREGGQPLSYMQLVEVAVVAALRQAGMSLKAIRQARDYLSTEFGNPYPFATYRFQTDGKELQVPFEQIIGPGGAGKLFSANSKGQLGWSEIIRTRLCEFEYDEDLALRWHVGGEGSSIIIDPRVAFGAPAVKGVPTWSIRERWASGEPAEETAEDFGLATEDVRSVLLWEGVDPNRPRPQPWLN